MKFLKNIRNAALLTVISLIFTLPAGFAEESVKSVKTDTKENGHLIRSMISSGPVYLITDNSSGFAAAWQGKRYFGYSPLYTGINLNFYNPQQKFPSREEFIARHKERKDSVQNRRYDNKMRNNIEIFGNANFGFRTKFFHPALAFDISTGIGYKRDPLASNAHDPKNFGLSTGIGLQFFANKKISGEIYYNPVWNFKHTANTIHSIGLSVNFKHASRIKSAAWDKSLK
ncbi:MAG TPA: hypothetical protein DC049_17085 [Spirochaetia bacterium]|nr:hypothetical protein [Spirochaetia bacterium]